MRHAVRAGPVNRVGSQQAHADLEEEEREGGRDEERGELPQHRRIDAMLTGVRLRCAA